MIFSAYVLRSPQAGDGPRVGVCWAVGTAVQMEASWVSICPKLFFLFLFFFFFFECPEMMTVPEIGRDGDCSVGCAS